MNFWIFAIALLVIPAVIMSWPLFNGSGKERFTAVWIILIIPLAGVLLYQQIGTPEAINLAAVKPQASTSQQQAHGSQQGQMDDLLASLQQRMSENPDDAEGWLILGRSLKTMKRYTEAHTALSNANRLTPDNPMIMIELAETSLFASGQASISAQDRQLIKAALAIDPHQQKGLWLIGMAAAQDGNEAQAITFWKKLLDQLDPASGGARTVTQQIEMAQGRLGQAAPVAAAAETTMPKAAVPEAATAKTVMPEATAAGFNIPVAITINDEMAAAISANASLFVFIHPAGAVGMPLAVKRLRPGGFPLTLRFSDADLLRPGMSLQDFEKVDISARISMAGIANAASGDIQANLVTVDTKAVTAIALHLDQRVP